MSAQAGLLHFDSRPILPEVLASVSRYLEPFGPDAVGHYAAPGFVMIHRALHITPEDSLCDQPLRSESGYVMTWDGRLDNRDDLLLQLWHDAHSQPADGTLALMAYCRWGEEGLARLIGDWSCVLWNERRRELTLASDYAGNRALYYWQDSSAIHWSTSLAEIVDRLNLRERLEQRFMVGYLAGALPPEITPYRNVWCVPAAHLIRWSCQGQMTRRRFWQLNISLERHPDPRTYEARLRSLFAEAVRSRLRSTRPVWAELSGGLDSSSVVCTADQLVSQSTHLAPVETVSYITDASPESDERTFIAAVEEHRNKRGWRVIADAYYDLTDDKWGWVTPLHPTGTALALRRLVQKHGGRVLISGGAGDLVMMNFPNEIGGVVEALVDLRIGTFAQRLHAWSRACRKTVWNGLYQTGLLLLPYGRRLHVFGDVVRPRLTARATLRAAEERYHLTESAAQVWLPEAERKWALASRISVYSKCPLLLALTEVTDLRRLQAPPEMECLTYTHPFLARPLVEFMLSIPSSVACAPGQPRALMRSALSDLLPDKVSRRFSKGYLAPLLLRRLRSWTETMPTPDRFQLVRESYVDRDKLRRSVDEVRSGSSRQLRNLEAIFILERWMRCRSRCESPYELISE